MILAPLFFIASHGDRCLGMTQIPVPAANLKQAVSLFLQRAVGVSLLVILQRVVAILQDAPQNQLETQFLQWIVAILMLPWYRTNVTRLLSPCAQTAKRYCFSCHRKG